MRQRQRIVLAAVVLTLVAAAAGAAQIGPPRPLRVVNQTAAFAGQPSVAPATDSPSPEVPATPSASVTQPPEPTATGTTATPVASPTPPATPGSLPTPTSPATPSIDPAVRSLGLFGPALNPVAPGVSCLEPPLNDYATCRFNEASGMSMTFYLYVPRDFDPRRSYPLVLLLEGGGEREDPAKTPDQNRQTLLDDPYAAVWGPGANLPDAPDVQARYPSFVVIPQVQLPQFYMPVPANTGSYTLAPQPTDALRMAKEIVDTLQQDIAQIDAKRLYVTGLSMGGYGTWELIERYPGYFAAAAPICGGGDPALAPRLVGLPLWAFHSADDPIVPVAASRAMIAAIRAAGGQPRYTEFTDQGHGAWLAPYGILGRPSPVPDFYAWLFSQHQ